MYKYLFLFLFFVPMASSAQVNISGKVTSLVNKKAIPDASVFLSHSRFGTKTGNDGNYDIYSVKDGEYDLVVSCIGYETFYKHISVRYDNIKLPDIELMPRMNQLAEVKIRPSKKIKRDWKRERYVRMFTDEFIGRTSNAAECTILNTELLNFDFDEQTRKFTARTNDFLIIENKALGYRVKYLVKTFLIDQLSGIISYTGSSVFESLPGDALKQEVWRKNREISYRISSMRFLRACIADNLQQNDFYVFKLIRNSTNHTPDSVSNLKIRQYMGFNPDSVRYYKKELQLPKFDQIASGKPLKPDDFVKVTGEGGVFDLTFEDGTPLMVNYKRKDNSSGRYTSYITFVQPDIYFDSNGVIFTPKNAMISGYWATLRVGDLFPVDYEPGK